MFQCNNIYIYIRRMTKDNNKHDLYVAQNMYVINPYPANVENTELLLVFQYTSISNKMQRYTVYLYLEIALHVSGGTSTHHHERTQLYLQHLVFVTPLLLSSAMVEELEPVGVCWGWSTPPTAHSNRFQLFHDSGR
jgi:hypothetical protein